MTLTSSKKIDERNVRYLDRSDTFDDAKVEEVSADGMRMVMSASIKQQYFLFGTDNVGRDLLSRTLMAGRISLAIGLLAGLVAVVIGVLYGAAAGFLGGKTDEIMMRIVDVLYSLPFIFFVIMLVVFFGRNFVLMFLAVGAVLWLDMARIVRGQALSIRRQEYVAAAEALGVGQRGILLRHVIPNLLGPVVIYMTLLVPQVIILESFLSFLGLGVQEPMTSWGVLISAGAKNIGTRQLAAVLPRLLPRLDAVRAELHRRRPARRARPEGPLSHERRRSHPRGERFAGPLPHARRRRRGGEGHQPPRQCRRDGRDRRRIRLGQEPDHDGGDAAARLQRRGDRRGRLSRPQPARRSASPRSTRSAAARSA